MNKRVALIPQGINTKVAPERLPADLAQSLRNVDVTLQRGRLIRGPGLIRTQRQASDSTIVSSFVPRTPTGDYVPLDRDDDGGVNLCPADTNPFGGTSGGGGGGGGAGGGGGGGGGKGPGQEWDGEDDDSDPEEPGDPFDEADELEWVLVQLTGELSDTGQVATPDVGMNCLAEYGEGVTKQVGCFNDPEPDFEPLLVTEDGDDTGLAWMRSDGASVSGWFGSGSVTLDYIGLSDTGFNGTITVIRDCIVNGVAKTAGQTVALSGLSNGFTIGI